MFANTLIISAILTSVVLVALWLLSTFYFLLKIPMVRVVMACFVAVAAIFWAGSIVYSLFYELIHPDYDSLYGSKSVKIISNGIQKRLETLYEKGKGKPGVIVIPVNKLLGSQHWETFCYMGGYSSLDSLEIAGRFADENVKSQWEYVDEEDGVILIVQDKLMIPVKETIHLDGQHFRKCYNKDKPFQFTLGVFGSRKGVQFVYDPKTS